MRLVLGLAALAVTLSGAAGVGQNGPAIAKTDLAKAQKMGDDAFVQEKKDARIADLEHGHTTAKLRRVAGDAYYTLNETSADNDSAATAQDFGPIISNEWDFTHYSSSGSPTLKSIDIIGNIAQDKGQDWYKFTIYGKADFRIDLTNIPNQCDYDISLFKRSNGPNETADYEITNIAGSALGSNQDEHISTRLLPGVYFVKVFSYRGYGSPTYTLTVDGKYVRQDVCIEDMMAKGANAALWYSDYDPFGIKPSITDITAHDVGDDYSRFFDHSENYFHYYPEFPHVLNQSYKQAEIFVWGKEYRNKLRAVIRKAIEQAEEKYTEAVNICVATKKDGNTITIIIGAVGAIASFFSFGSSAAAAAAGVISLSCSLAGLAYEAVSMLLPMGMNFEDYRRFIDYLGDLHAALECDAYTSDTEVVRIPIRYTLKKIETNGPVVSQANPPSIYDWYFRKTYAISYVPEQREWNYLYNDGGKQPGQRRYIHAIDHEGDTPFTGTIFPIFDSDSVNKAWNRQTYDMSYQTLTVNAQSSSFSLNDGGYKWFKFTAPRTATFYFTSEGDAEATFELFDSMVYGKSTYQRKTKQYQNNGLYSGFKYSKYLNAGDTVYFRVSGGDERFIPLSYTTVKVSDKNSNEKTVSFYACDLNIAAEYWDAPLLEPSTFLNNKGFRVVAKESARISYGNDYLELEADTEEDYPRAYITIQFDRPVKRIAFDAAYGTEWRYARNPLIINGFNSNGQNVVTHWADTMYCGFFDHYERYSFLLQDPSQGLNDAVYSIQLLVDPIQTQDSYHNHYELVQLDGFMIEFAD